MAKKLKRRTKIMIAGGAAVVIVAVFFVTSPPPEPRFLEQARDLLRKEGFKTGLAEFDFNTSSEIRARVAALTNNLTSHVSGNPAQSSGRRTLQQLISESMVRTGSNSVVLAWKQEKWPVSPDAMSNIEPRERLGRDFWPELREIIERERVRLNAAAAAAIAGPIRFHLDAGQGHALLLPHLVAVKEYARLFGLAAVLELHDRNSDLAWTNVLAATRLVTGWAPEPTDISVLVRFACTRLAFNTIWQALPAGWPEERLADLQREWEGTDFFKDLPETAAYARASAVATCAALRKESFSLGVPLSQLIRGPSAAWSTLEEYRRQTSYRRHGTFEDERDLLLHFRDRELELRRAVQARSWMEMRQLSGVANVAVFQSKYPSRLQAIMNLKQMILSSQTYSPLGQAGGILGRAADAESHRRLIVTAIALERYRSQKGAYPDALENLVPDFLKVPPTDFMDGQPLRYRLQEDGYSLYSVGMDCTDDGGVMPQSGRTKIHHGRADDSAQSGPASGKDLVWPRAASEEEIEALHREQKAALAERIKSEQEFEAEWQRRAE